MIKSTNEFFWNSSFSRMLRLYKCTLFLSKKINELLLPNPFKDGMNGWEKLTRNSQPLCNKRNTAVLGTVSKLGGIECNDVLTQQMWYIYVKPIITSIII